MKEKWVRINTIESYEDVREWYWISNADEDKIINTNTGKQLKIGIDNNGYKRVHLRTKDGKKKTCSIHVLKARAFIYSPNPLGYNVVRHLNDIKTDNRLINLVWGTQSNNNLDCVRNGNYNYEAAAKNLAKGSTIGGKITGAKNGKKTSKPVRCIETGIIYPSCIEASRQTGIHNASISACCNGKQQTAGGYHWEFINKEEV